MLVIEGEITLTTPLHIASPNGKKIGNDGFFVSEASREAKSVTTVVKMPIILKDAIFIENNNGIDDKLITRIEVPTINANLLRGRLRRECANLIFESLCDREETIPLQMAHVLTCLSTSGQPSGEAVLKYDYVKMSREHVFAGVWGGGTHLLKSGITLFNAMPIHDFMLENSYTFYGLRHKERQDISVNSGRNQLGYLGLTYVTDIFKRDNILHFDCPLLENVITNYNDTIRDYQDKRLVAKQEKKERNTKKSDLDNMFGMETIAPGTSFTFRLEFADYIDGAQIGLVLLGIERMKKRQGLGGAIRYGMGRFDFNYDLYEVNHDESFDQLDDEVINEYFCQAKEAVANITESDLMKIYRDPESNEDKDKTKAILKNEKEVA